MPLVSTRNAEGVAPLSIVKFPALATFPCLTKNSPRRRESRFLKKSAI